MTKLSAGVAFAAALVLAGCGGTEQQSAGSMNTAAPMAGAPMAGAPMTGMPMTGKAVGTGVRCSNKDWQDIFWSDATHTVQVGALTCSCFQEETLDGVESNFITLAYEDTCDTQ